MENNLLKAIGIGVASAGVLILIHKSMKNNAPKQAPEDAQVKTANQVKNNADPIGVNTNGIGIMPTLNSNYKTPIFSLKTKSNSNLLHF
jgi:hypothetical protein